MSLRDRNRPMAAMLAVLAVAIGLAACGSSDATDGSTVTSAPTATQPVATDVTVTAPAETVPVTVPATTTTVEIAPSETMPGVVATAPTPTTAVTETVVVTDAEVADLEQQLDEIDQLLAGIDADLSQD